jgi:hypothetical protein
MPIADSTLILEGQQDFSGGMDSSLSPTLINPNTVATAVNVTFRGGRPTTRPGFKQIALSAPSETSGLNSGLDIFTTGYFQGTAFYLERRDNYNSSILGVFSGRVVRINLGTLVTEVLYPDTPAGSFVAGRQYTISFAGTTNWSLIGAPSASPAVGTTFTATGIGTGNGLAYSKLPVFDPFANCYFVQAEKYMIIQNGLNPAIIYDGDKIYTSGVGFAGTIGAISGIHTVGPGTVMAYGQGRLFVADSSRTSIAAGDLVYGGSTDQVTITTGTANSTTSSYTFSTGAVQNGFVIGDRVTVTGHSTNFGLNGTWRVKAVNNTSSPYSFDIDFTSPSSQTVVNGSGGFVAKANAGAESDLLRFTETTYLNEGGTAQVPAFMGKITGMVFMPVQDTGTGQGDLLVFCEKGTATFAVSAPRETWKELQGFQRVVFSTVGATSQNSLVTTNGDVFFRSFDGLRSYRNARASLESWGQVPMSAEMDSVLPYDTKSLLGSVSAIIFDNRLLFTASPVINYSGLNPTVVTKQPVTFSKIIAMDFTTLSTARGKTAASYDGIWAGLNVTQLLSGLVNGVPQGYIFAFDYTNNRVNALWQMTENGLYDHPVGVTPQRINSILETKSYSFGSAAEQKKLIRSDFWFSNINGTLDVNVYWRPDQYPCWRPWHSFSRCATTETCITTGATVTPGENGIVTVTFSSQTPSTFSYRLVKNGTATLPIVYTYNPDATAQEQAVIDAFAGVGIDVAFVTRSGDFPNYSFLIATIPLPKWEQYTDALDVWESMGVWQAPYSPSLAPTTDYYTLTPVKNTGETACSSNFTVKNLQPQYRPQIRMPTPPEDSDPIISRPYYYGNDFQLRLEFTGHFELNRVLMLGQRILEQYQGTDNLEVL